MLRLASATDPGWVERALAGLPDVLLDHAHCEKKAASTALTLIFRYPEQGHLVVPLTRLAREELAHFEEVLRHMEERGISFGRQRPSPYAGQLQSAVRGTEPARLVDLLLCSAFIEARSCERMKLLASALPDPELAALYDGLLAAEARHHQLFLDLAFGVAGVDPAQVERRVEELAAHEAWVLTQAPPWPRMHC